MRNSLTLSIETVCSRSGRVTVNIELRKGAQVLETHSRTFDAEQPWTVWVETQTKALVKYLYGWRE